MSKRGLSSLLSSSGNNSLRQHLAQLHAPLIERIDLPDGALGENAMLVKGDQLAESLRSEPLGEDGIRRAVALKNPVRDEPIRRAFSLDLLRRLSERERFVWAKTFASSMSCWWPSGLSGCPNAMKSQGISRVPW